jgi:hypothetical protein
VQLVGPPVVPPVMPAVIPPVMPPVGKPVVPAEVQIAAEEYPGGAQRSKLGSQTIGPWLSQQPAHRSQVAQMVA